MNLPEPIQKTYGALISDIEKGQIKIPQFQRNFVWHLQKSADLIDSIIKGYPIGTFIFWRTKERLRTIRDIGNVQLPEPKEGEFVDFVLDGQQRLTSLYASIKGIKIERENRKDDYSNIFINLDTKEDDETIVFVDIDGLTEHTYIKLKDLLDGQITYFFENFDEKYYEKIEEYKTRIKTYNFPIVQVKEIPIDIATEIFTRINIGGKSLSLFEIMVAKTFDIEKEFDLSDKFHSLIEKLEKNNYETISDSTVLQTVSILLTKECTKKQILKLEKNEFIAIWDTAIDAIKRAIDYFRDFYRIPVSKLLPYNSLIIPFSYFFYYHKDDRPSSEQQKYLLDFFWRISLTGRYSSGVEGKLAQDIKRIDDIVKNTLPKYDWSLNITPEYILDNGYFRVGSSFIKAILCLYAYHQPKSFQNNSIVRIDNSWLKQANSKNYHHFFPKSFLGKENKDWHIINHVVNITIVDDYLNKKVIGSKSPSVYMKEFEKDNTELSETMKTHLIDNIDEYGVWNDDYDKFLDCRLKLICSKLKKDIIEQKMDREKTTVLHEDYAEEE